MGWGCRAAQRLCRRFRERHTPKGRSPDFAFRKPAFEIVVRFRDISWTGTTQRHGMPGTRPICGGIFREEADHRVKTVPAQLRWSLRWLRLSSVSHRPGGRGAEPVSL